MTARSKNNKSMTSKNIEMELLHFQKKHSSKMLFMAGVLLLMLLFCLFKNISYPLFWADESMTVMGSERVIKFGYPKVHDGKNVFYDLWIVDPMIGINKEDDAYIGGAGWGQYYYGVIGYKLAQYFDNDYSKTGIYRASFAVIGLLGLLFIAFIISRFFQDKFNKYLFFSLFLFFELISVSLLLLMREARYYPLAIFLCSLVIGLYIAHRFYKPLHNFIYVPVSAAILWLIFITFAPLYFILSVSIGLSEIFIAINLYIKKQKPKTIITDAVLCALPLFVSFLFILPLLEYFQTFEISKVLKINLNYGAEIYRNNLFTVFGYYNKFEPLWLALALKLIVIFNYKKIIADKDVTFQVSNFLSLVFVVFVFTIPEMPNKFIFTRYIIYVQPFLSIVIILDFFLLIKILSRSRNKYLRINLILLCLMSATLLLYPLKNNAQYYSDYMHKLTYPYKGPLDYVIPYIKNRFPQTEDLVIATNYEETSFMYYLKSKTTVGFVGNNLKEDVNIQPDIISYRKMWDNHAEIFEIFMQRADYEEVIFPVYDSPTNNIPELNFIRTFNHKFRTISAENDQEAAKIYILKKK